MWINKVTISVIILAILFSSENVTAQMIMQPIVVPMPQPDVCGGYSDSWSANCRRDSNDNMIDGTTGDVYNSDGDLIRRGRRGNTNQNQQQRSGSTSGRTRLQIVRDMAHKPKYRNKMQRAFCGNYNRPTVGGYRFSAYEMAVVREELGC
jgi:hypothetical protein